MKNKVFYIIITIICLIGIVSTGFLVKHTIDLSRNLSITSYISNEEWVMEKKKLIKQILIIFVIVLGFILFNYSFYNINYTFFLNILSSKQSQSSLHLA